MAQTAGAIAGAGVFGGAEGAIGAGIGGIIGGAPGALISIAVIDPPNVSLKIHFLQ